MIHNILMKKRILTILFIISILFMLPIWAFFIEPNLLFVKHYRIKNENLAGIRIVFAADFHLRSHQEYRLKQTIKKINAQKPDILLLGGDFIDGISLKKSFSLPQTALYLSKINAPYGVYSVVGNHEYWSGDIDLKKILLKHGITVLSNENTPINIKGKKLYIAGIEDSFSSEPDIDKALKNSGQNVIVLTHSPDIFPKVPDSVILTLAGHTHGGQIRIPFYGALFIPSEFGKRYAEGLIVEGSKKMIVTRGIGTSTIHIRFNCPPEIVVIDFE